MAITPLLWRNWSRILCQRCRAIRSMANRCATESTPMEHSCFIQSGKTEWIMAEIHLQLLIPNQNPFRGKKAATWFGHGQPHRRNNLMKPRIDINEHEAGRGSWWGRLLLHPRSGEPHRILSYSLPTQLSKCNPRQHALRAEPAPRQGLQFSTL